VKYANFDAFVNNDRYVEGLSESVYTRLYMLYSKFLHDKHYAAFKVKYDSWLGDSHEVLKFSGLSDDDQGRLLGVWMGKYDKDTVSLIQEAFTFHTDWVGYLGNSSLDWSGFPGGGLAQARVSLDGFFSMIVSRLRAGSEFKSFLGDMLTVLGTGYRSVLGDAVVMIWLLNRGVNLSHYQSYMNIGKSKYFSAPVTTLDDYNTKKTLLDKELGNANLQYDKFIAGGNKPVGDRETEEEFNVRFKAWQQREVTRRYTDHALDPVTPPEFHDPTEVWLDSHNNGKIHVIGGYLPGKETVSGGGVQRPGWFIGSDNVTQCQQLDPPLDPPSKRRKFGRVEFGGGGSSLAAVRNDDYYYGGGGDA
jgi:hypothetical protein